MDILVLPLEESHLPEARRIFRLAFGTFIGLSDPQKFAPGMDYYAHRRLMFPEGAWGAFEGDRLVGSVLTSRWGSMGSFGPLTIDPEYWDRGIGQRLLEPVMDCFRSWGTQIEGIFTFSSSPKHLALYQRYGFFPGGLVGIMAKRVEVGSSETLQDFRAFSRMPEADGAHVLESCRSLTGDLFPGMDLTQEIECVAERKLGETLLLGEGREIDAFAICHQGRGTEAGVMGTYVKFGAVRPGSDAAGTFLRLVQACEAYARTKGSPAVVMGMNTARQRAYQVLLSQGYRIEHLGVAMHRCANGHYHHTSDFVIEDLR